MSKAEGLLLVVLIVVLVIGGVFFGSLIGKSFGRIEMENKAIEAKIAERFVVWDKTNQPYLEFRWITNR